MNWEDFKNHCIYAPSYNAVLSASISTYTHFKQAFSAPHINRDDVIFSKSEQSAAPATVVSSTAVPAVFRGFAKDKAAQKINK